MRISIEKNQEEKISRLQQQLVRTKKENRSLKNKLTASERKRKSLMEENRKKNSAPQAYLLSR
jgi:septal ring factor EnvC (AmiA/AmiB activator)